MDDASLELTIQMDDLKELARINPVAWEQLLHIVDNRQNAERITELEAHLEEAHSKLIKLNGHDVSMLDETAVEPASKPI